MPPRVSICLPNLNNRPFLEERLQSIYEQTFEDWELIIVDNYSDDGAWELFQEHAEREPRIKLSQAPKAGMYANWNNTLEKAEGEWIYIATSDDTMYAPCLESCLSAVERNAKENIVMFGIDTIDKNSTFIEHWHQSGRKMPAHTFGLDLLHEGPLSSKKEFIAQVFAAGVYQSITGVLFHRSVFETIGPFPNEFGSAGDTYWIMEAVRHFPVYWMPDNLATWRLHDQQGSRQKRKATAGLVTEREQAVNLALENAIKSSYLTDAELNEIRRFQLLNSKTKRPIQNLIERVLNKIFKLNCSSRRKARWIESVFSLDQPETL